MASTGLTEVAQQKGNNDVSDGISVPEPATPSPQPDTGGHSSVSVPNPTAQSRGETDDNNADSKAAKAKLHLRSPYVVEGNEEILRPGTATELRVRRTVSSGRVPGFDPQ